MQIPTTLLAQVDSSVGGKTGINTAHGKNLVGAFHQPRMVLADTDDARHPAVRELRAGYAEIAKAGLIGDAALLRLVRGATAPALVARRPRARRRRRSCAPAPSRPPVVGDDEREEKPNDGRALLNLGHTFGHALEAELGYGAVCCTARRSRSGIGLALPPVRPARPVRRRRTPSGVVGASGRRSACRAELDMLNRRLLGRRG